MEGNETKLLLTTMHGTKKVSTKAVDGLILEHFQQNAANVKLPQTFVRQEIPSDREEILRAEMLSQWPHLKKIAKKIPPNMEDTEMRILIGLNCPSVLSYDREM